MKVLELFAGTRSIGKAFEQAGHEVYSVEWSKDFENIDLYADIGELTAADILEQFGKPDIIWASPDCSTYSVAAISTHRRKDPKTGELIPLTEYAKFCDKVNAHVVELIKELDPKYYFVENPRGGVAKNVFHARLTAIHGYILPIRSGSPDRQATGKTYGHMDKSPEPAIFRAVQTWRVLPYARAQGKQSGDTGVKERKGQERYTAVAVFPYCENKRTTKRNAIEAILKGVKP